MTPGPGSANRRERILFVTHSAAAAGAELLLLRLLRNERPQDVAVIFLEQGDLVEAFAAEGIPVEVVALDCMHAFRRESGLAAAARRLPAVQQAMRRLAPRIRPGDTVVASSQKALVLLGLIRLRRRDFTLVWWLHDVLDRSHFSRLSIFAGVQLSRRLCSWVIANSTEAREAYLRAGGPAGLTGVVEPGIDLEEFAPRPAETLHGAPAAAPQVIVSVSRIAPWKGQHTLIEAMAALPDAEAWIVGGPLFGETAYLDQLKRRVAELGLSGRVRFLGHREDISALLHRATVFVHVPSEVEPFGQVVVEAMASGVPVLASNVGAPARIVTAGGGVTVAPGNPRELAEALRRLLSDEAGLRESAAKGVAFAQRYDIREMRKTFFNQVQCA